MYEMRNVFFEQYIYRYISIVPSGVTWNDLLDHDYYNIYVYNIR